LLEATSLSGDADPATGHHPLPEICTHVHHLFFKS